MDDAGRLTDDDPGKLAFGFGRRRWRIQSIRYDTTHKCLSLYSGRYAADASLWSAVVTMLAMLDFNLAKDADGNNVEFEATFMHGIIEYVWIDAVLHLWS